VTMPLFPLRLLSKQVTPLPPPVNAAARQAL
jgi:hypothetical protein